MKRPADMTLDQKIALRHLFDELANEALTLGLWEGEDYEIYLWGSHNPHSDAVQELVEEHLEETVGYSDEQYQRYVDALDGGQEFWAHPAALDLDGDAWPKAFVSEVSVDGWVPFLRGELS